MDLHKDERWQKFQELQVWSGRQKNGEMISIFNCTGDGTKVDFTCTNLGGPHSPHGNCTQVSGGDNNGESFTCGPGNHDRTQTEAQKPAETRNGTGGKEQDAGPEDKDGKVHEKGGEQDKEKDKTTEKGGDGPGHTVERRGAGTQPKDTQPKSAEPKNTQPKGTQPKNTIFVSAASFFSVNLPIVGHFVLRSALSSFALGPSRLC
ncbi:hypothetical protein ERJ75_000863500 [Trypanosoma vivax]|nr:hypothetical protein ERJ75_000863500 [Trypanosoma vivax]